MIGRAQAYNRMHADRKTPVRVARAFRIASAVLLACWGAQCAAQAVYESKDKSGATVFSDRPTPGAKPMDLPQPNVVQTPAVPKRAPAPAAAAAPYTSVAISSLENEGTVHTNTGEFQVLVRSVPALRAAAGDRIRAMIDGNLLPRKYSRGAVHVSAEEWQGAAAENAQHTLQVAIVDSSGTTLIESKPITFYSRRATVRKRAR